MERRDLLKDQIEQTGKVLAKILVDFLDSKNQYLLEEAMESAEEQLRGRVDLELNELITLPYAELRAYLTERNLTTHHLEMLSDLLREMASALPTWETKVTQKRYETALDLLEIADDISQTLSIVRNNRKAEIRRIIETQSKHSS